ncbi:MAG TPA: aminotransferase class V-fold PLP-dependent enzyme [Gaiellaceae bacterium]|nr:aminotransferase class V-fold PLP-dependent enzyme [Gaiellaceae bacterium]
MDTAAARACFPGLRDATFLDHACVGLAPEQAVRAVEEVARRGAVCEERDAFDHHVALDAIRDDARREAAVLLGAGEDEVSLVESTTQGLNLAALAIPFEPGDNVVIADLEFLQVAIPFVKLAEEGRIAEVRLARNADGALPVEAFAAVVDERTRAVVVSSVQWCNGYRLDLRGLRALCREAGAVLVVDAIQELGALRLDVRDTPVDLLVAGGHKWLNAPYGCGVLYVDRRVLPALRQPWWGYLALDPPAGGWPAYFGDPTPPPLRPYDFPATARALELGGTSSYPGAAALAASLALVNEVGIAAAERRVLELSARLRDEVDALGLELVSPREAPSGITVFRSSSDPDDDRRLLARLLDERVLVSIRYAAGVGGIRVSTHYSNDESDLDRLVSTLQRLRVSRPAA